MAVLVWPSGLKAPSRYSPGVIPVQVQPAALGPIRDVVHRYTLRTLTLEWDNMTNTEFAQVDALVDLLGGKRSTVRVPWRPYQAMIGGGTSAGTVTINGAHSAGDSTVATSGWGGTNPILAYGDMVQIGAAVPRLHRVLAAATHSAGNSTISIEPPLWRDHSNGESVYHLRRLDGSNPEPFLTLTMQLADPSQVQGQVFASPAPQYGRGIILAFVEAHRTVY